MTPTEIKRLRVGDRVMWEGDPGDLGTVTDAGYRGVTVAWDNGQTGTVLRDGPTTHSVTLAE